MTKPRVLIYDGPEDWIRSTIDHDLIRGSHRFTNGSITSIYPSKTATDDCPVCGSDEVEPSGTPDFMDPPYMSEERICRRCESRWTARYVFYENVITDLHEIKERT